MSVGRAGITKGQAVATSGFLVKFDTHLWQLQLPFYFKYSKENLAHIVEIMRGIIEHRTMQGIDYRGKPFAKYHNKREEQGAPVESLTGWPYEYKNKNKGIVKPYWERQKEFKRRPGAQRHTTEGTKWGYKYKKTGDKVTLHGKNNPNTGAWEWTFDTPLQAKANWAYGKDCDKYDGLFYFYPYCFDRKARRTRKGNIAKKKKGSWTERNVADQKGKFIDQMLYKKRRNERKDRNHPLWVLNFGRASETSQARWAIQIPRMEEKIKRLEDWMANPTVFWAKYKQHLSYSEVEAKMIAYKKGGLTQRDYNSLAKAWREHQRSIKRAPKRLAKMKEDLEVLKYKAQRAKEVTLKVPERKWFGFTDQEANQVLDYIEWAFDASWGSYDTHVIKNAAVLSDEYFVQREMEIHNSSGIFQGYEEARAMLDVVHKKLEEQALEHMIEQDAAMKRADEAMARMAGECYMGLHDYVNMSDTKDYQELIKNWWEAYVNYKYSL